MLIREISINSFNSCNSSSFVVSRKASAGPEARGDVLERAVGTAAIEALVGSRLLQGAEVADVGPDLDVVEVLLAHRRGHAQPAAIPGHAQLRPALMDVAGQAVHLLRVCVAAHEGQAGDVGAILDDEIVQHTLREWLAHVVPKILAVAARASARAAGDIDGQRRLVGDFLEDDARIDIFQHGSFFLIHRPLRLARSGASRGAKRRFGQKETALLDSNIGVYYLRKAPLSGFCTLRRSSANQLTCA